MGKENTGIQKFFLEPMIMAIYAYDLEMSIYASWVVGGSVHQNR